MKRIMLTIAAAACLIAPAAAQGPTDQEMIDRSLLGAPANMRAAAQVIKWDASGKRVVIKEGTNGMACWDQSVWPGQRPFSVHCTSVGSLERVEQNREAFYKAGNKADGEKLLKEMEANKTRKLPEYGAGHYGLEGNDQATARPHVTIAAPFATTDNAKLPTKNPGASAWLMDAGTSGAHIMIPGH